MGKVKLFGPCVRYGNMTSDEKHPCYICGYPIPVTIKYCKCGIIKCPECGACACPSSMSKGVFNALIKLRNKYCCNPINFAKGVSYEDRKLLDLVPNYMTAFNYCRNLELESAKRLNSFDGTQREGSGSRGGAVPSYGASRSNFRSGRSTL